MFHKFSIQYHNLWLICVRIRIWYAIHQCAFDITNTYENRENESKKKEKKIENERKSHVRNVNVLFKSENVCMRSDGNLTSIITGRINSIKKCVLVKSRVE